LTGGDTIAALATPPGVGAISTIRMSGPSAIQICDQVFRGKRKPSAVPDRSVVLGEVTASDGAPIDQVLVTIMRGPHSLTGEDVVEISGHGGRAAPRLILKRLVEMGARPAGPGEFMRRAYLGGKLDLAQAEAVAEIVRAESDRALALAVRQLKGELSERLGDIEDSLTDWLAIVEANIDFVEEEIEPVDPVALGGALRDMSAGLKHLLATFDQGRVVREGLEVAIVGKPNTGKSSLFNRLVGTDRVMVSAVPGTTRDVVDGKVWINGYMVKIHDTAGLWDGDDALGREAGRRTEAALDRADMAIVVLDLSRPLSDEDFRFARLVSTKPHVYVANKADLPRRADPRPEWCGLEVSALKGWGLKDLLARLEDMAHERIGDLGLEVGVNERHAACLKPAIEALGRAGKALGGGVPLEFVASDMRCALDSMGEITGRTVGSSVLDRIFSRFCIGK
jgi:tRNA modification GTPase